MASWDLICSGNLHKNRLRSNLDVFLLVVSGHRDKMLSMSTNGFFGAKVGEIQKVIDLLNVRSAIRHAQVLLELFVGVSKQGKIVYHVLYQGHCLRGEFPCAVVVLGDSYVWGLSNQNPGRLMVELTAARMNSLPWF